MTASSSSSASTKRSPTLSRSSTVAMSEYVTASTCRPTLRRATDKGEAGVCGEGKEAEGVRGEGKEAERGGGGEDVLWRACDGEPGSKERGGWLASRRLGCIRGGLGREAGYRGRRGREGG